MSGPHKRSIISIVFSLCFNCNWFSAIYRCKYFRGSFDALLTPELIRVQTKQPPNKDTTITASTILAIRTKFACSPRLISAMSPGLPT